jgi:hypothetical protein
MWGRLPDPGPYPRDVERLARYGFLAQVRRLPGLTLSAAHAWLRRQGHRRLPEAVDRRLHGYLFAGGTLPVVFLDPGDAAAVQRYALAHELAHLWWEVLAPRERLRTRLGEGVLDALEGRRAASAAEKLQALASGVSLRPVGHLLARDRELGVVDGGISLAEERADRLALELLAPEHEARRALPAPAPWREWLPAASERLERAFGIPAGVAAAYARALLPPESGPTFWERFSGAHRER